MIVKSTIKIPPSSMFWLTRRNFYMSSSFHNLFFKNCYHYCEEIHYRQAGGRQAAGRSVYLYVIKRNLRTYTEGRRGDTEEHGAVC